MEKKITLVTRNNQSFEEVEARFNVTTTTFNRFMNAMGSKDKVAPTNNFLFDTVHPDDKQNLRDLLKEDGHGTLLAGELVEQYMPNVQITVKKPESGQKPTKKAA